MTREEIAEKVAWIIAGMAAEYHGRTIEPGQVFPSDTLVMHGIDDHLALFEFSYLAEKTLGIAVSDELLDLDNDATVARNGVCRSRRVVLRDALSHAGDR